MILPSRIGNTSVYAFRGYFTYYSINGKSGCQSLYTLAYLQSTSIASLISNDRIEFDAWSADYASTWMPEQNQIYIKEEYKNAAQSVHFVYKRQIARVQYEPAYKVLGEEPTLESSFEEFCQFQGGTSELEEEGYQTGQTLKL